MKHTDSAMKIRRPSCGYNFRKCYGEAVYHDGYVTTQHGYVQVYSDGRGTKDATTSMWFAYGGKEYKRVFPEAYQQSYLVTLADRFAAAVVAGEVQA